MKYIANIDGHKEDYLTVDEAINEISEQVARQMYDDIERFGRSVVKIGVREFYVYGVNQ